MTSVLFKVTKMTDQLPFPSECTQNHPNLGDSTHLNLLLKQERDLQQPSPDQLPFPSECTQNHPNLGDSTHLNLLLKQERDLQQPSPEFIPWLSEKGKPVIYPSDDMARRT
ncbi:uncharacterized protein [Apostichopus japonicus]|uniref:uncharacterized protein n=1 Tax=Stichopus japonicus TaxID=307972 RepID=UPI003AB2A981